MTMTSVDEEILREFNGNPPATASSIRQVEGKAKLRFPEEYTQFLQKMDGGEGFIDRAYAIFWRVGELLEMNEAYQVSDYAPGLFLFGSDGGGEAFAFDARSDVMEIVCVPFVGMDLKLVRPMASNFKVFLDELFNA
jgi:hypothetical protein